MSSQELKNLKDIILKVKDIVDDESVIVDLQTKVDATTGMIQGTNFNYRDFAIHLNTWNTSVIMADNYEQLSPFVHHEHITGTKNAFNNIFNALTDYKNNNFNAQYFQQHNAQGNFDNLKRSMLQFLPYVKAEIVKNIKKQWEFLKEKEAIDKYLAEARKLYTDLNNKEKEITEFYKALLPDANRTDDTKEGIKQFITDSYNQIKKKYNELFTETKQSKIGEQDVSASGELALIQLFVKDIYIQNTIKYLH